MGGCFGICVAKWVHGCVGRRKGILLVSAWVYVRVSGYMGMQVDGLVGGWFSI